MRRLHWISGALTVTAFLVSGAYMRWGVEPGTVDGEQRMVFISRHIYMLAPGLLHLVLAAYLQPIARARVARLQWAGSVLLVASSALLIAAFGIEPMAGRGRTAVSSFGLYSLWGGAFLHVISPWVDRRWTGG